MMKPVMRFLLLLTLSASCFQLTFAATCTDVFAANDGLNEKVPLNQRLDGPGQVPASGL
jgi:hypothetical protein